MRVNAMSAVFTSLAAYFIGLIVSAARLKIDDSYNKIQKVNVNNSNKEDSIPIYYGGSLGLSLSLSSS